MSTPFNTWINFKEEVREEEVNTLPSETQPDEVLTIREMLERHVRGLPMHGNEQGVYLPEEVGFIPDYRTLDLTEIDEYRNNFYHQMENLKNPPAPTPSAPAGGTPNTEGTEVSDKAHNPTSTPPNPINSPERSE